MNRKLYFLCAFLCFIGQVNLAMNEQPQETTRLIDSSKPAWTSCNYGQHFEKNKYTVDINWSQNHTCCRIHTSTTLITAICCIANIISPCNLSTNAAMLSGIYLCDQAQGYCHKPTHQEHVELYEFDPMNGQIKLTERINTRQFGSRLNCFHKQTQENSTIVYKPNPLHHPYQTVQSVHIQKEERK